MFKYFGEISCSCAIICAASAALAQPSEWQVSAVTDPFTDETSFVFQISQDGGTSCDRPASIELSCHDMDIDLLLRPNCGDIRTTESHSYRIRFDSDPAERITLRPSDRAAGLATDRPTETLLRQLGSHQRLLLEVPRQAEDPYIFSFPVQGLVSTVMQHATDAQCDLPWQLVEPLLIEDRDCPPIAAEQAPWADCRIAAFAEAARVQAFVDAADQAACHAAYSRAMAARVAPRGDKAGEGSGVSIEGFEAALTLSRRELTDCMAPILSAARDAAKRH